MIDLHRKKREKEKEGKEEEDKAAIYVSATYQEEDSDVVAKYAFDSQLDSEASIRYVFG